MLTVYISTFIDGQNSFLPSVGSVNAKTSSGVAFIMGDVILRPFDARYPVARERRCYDFEKFKNGITSSNRLQCYSRRYYEMILHLKSKPIKSEGLSAVFYLTYSRREVDKPSIFSSYRHVVINASPRKNTAEMST